MPLIPKTAQRTSFIEKHIKFNKNHSLLMINSDVKDNAAPKSALRCTLKNGVSAFHSKLQLSSIGQLLSQYK